MTGDDRIVLRDPELIELLADEPELLAILDAYAVTQAEEWQAATALRRRGFKPNRPVARRGLAAAVGVAIVIAVALLPARLGSDVSIVEHALAGVSAGPVLHAALEVPVDNVTLAPGPVSFTVVDPESGHERRASVVVELWYDANRGLLRLLQRNEGAVTWELLETRAGVQDSRGGLFQGVGSPTLDPALPAFFEGYKRALRNESATVAGRGTVNGRDVQWLRFPPSAAGRPPQEVAVDSETYRPLLLRTVCPDCSPQPPVYRIVTLEAVGEGAANFSPPPPRGGQRVAAYSGERQTITITEARSALGARALWAGHMVGDMKLNLVQVVRPSSHSGTPPTDANLIDRGVGLQLAYSRSGSQETGDEVLTVSESADYEFVFSGFNFNNSEAGQPLTRSGGAIPPDGEVALSSTQPGHWTAQLRTAGLFVEVNGPTRELVLKAVDALKPVSG